MGGQVGLQFLTLANDTRKPDGILCCAMHGCAVEALGSGCCFTNILCGDMAPKLAYFVLKKELLNLSETTLGPIPNTCENGSS